MACLHSVFFSPVSAWFAWGHQSSNLSPSVTLRNKPSRLGFQKRNYLEFLLFWTILNLSIDVNKKTMIFALGQKLAVIFFSHQVGIFQPFIKMLSFFWHLIKRCTSWRSLQLYWKNDNLFSHIFSLHPIENAFVFMSRFFQIKIQNLLELPLLGKTVFSSKFLLLERCKIKRIWLGDTSHMTFHKFRSICCVSMTA